jgi:hypothetical protein
MDNPMSLSASPHLRVSASSESSFIAITSEGGLLPADFLHELPAPKTTIEGVTPVAYHLAEGERLNEQINRSWNRLKGCWENFKKALAGKPAGDPATTDTRTLAVPPLSGTWLWSSDGCQTD